ncbi:hypothetical protein C0Q70_01286 [Pomacea canaliculata]|uniref:CCDC113/CCDC96 coiled-coil domain-containing protein n=1 Tax=Pomacea canaliculata TaxID=400727 RepID=A0A2T7PZ42_POMCA|nr:hypothetical protein C0Q70_01286 [Pomacea canaliculata]
MEQSPGETEEDKTSAVTEQKSEEEPIALDEKPESVDLPPASDEGDAQTTEEPGVTGAETSSPNGESEVTGHDESVGDKTATDLEVEEKKGGEEDEKGEQSERKDDEEEKKEEEVGQSVREDDNEDEKPEEEDNKDLGNEEVETSGDAQVDEGREEESKSPLPQGCPTYGPRAISGPRRCAIRPAKLLPTVQEIGMLWPATRLSEMDMARRPKKNHPPPLPTVSSRPFSAPEVTPNPTCLAMVSPSGSIRHFMALADREQLLQQNYYLQNKIAEYFRKKKSDERQDYEKNVTDQEQRYLKYMAQLDELQQQYRTEKDRYEQQIEDLKTRCEEKQKHVDAEHTRFAEFKKQVALNAINSRSGKPIPPKDIEQFLVNENKKEQEVVNVRLENIKLKNKLKKKEQQLKSKEELAEGLHLIDFEQLKIENQTYNEKIEERNEELLKLRKKITSTVQVLTHLKEKLQYVQGENHIQKANLMEVEAQAAQKRDILSRTKQARDALRIDNVKMRQSCGLLGNEQLLRDFQDRKDEGEELQTKLNRLKVHHAELTLNSSHVRRKIDQVRADREEGDD